MKKKDMDDSKLKYVVFGIQFNHAFKILDYWGEIADELLYNNNFFDSNYFTNISTQYTTERSVFNKNTGNSLRLTSNQLIYKCYIEGEFETDYKQFSKKIEEYLIPSIIKKYDLIVRRMGIVYAKELKNDCLQKFVEKYFKPNISGINDFRFSKKEATPQGRVWCGTNDYINKIFTVGTIGGEDDFIGISYDFQVYYDPVQREVRDKIKSFLIDSLKNFERDTKLDK